MSLGGTVHMATVAFGDILGVTIKGRVLNETFLSTFAYRFSSGDPGTDYFVAVDEFHAKFYTQPNSVVERFKNALTQSANVDEVWYQRIAPTRLVKVVKAPDDPGLFVSTAHTSNVAGVLERRGEEGTRKAVSTLHLPIGTDAFSTSNGVLVQNLKDAMDLLGLEMKNIITTATGAISWTPVIYNRGSTPNFTNIVQVFNQTTTRVMRRRTVGVGI